MGIKLVASAIILIIAICSITMLGCGVAGTTVTIIETQSVTVTETATQETVTETETEKATTPTPARNFDEEMYQRLLSYCEYLNNSMEYPDTIENEILYKFLSRPDAGGSYYVDVGPVNAIDNDIVSMRDEIIEWGNEVGCDISDLYDQLLEINEKPSLVMVKSSVKEGYFINYSGFFEGTLVYFLLELNSEESDYWKFMHTNFPRYAGSISVSMPAYDPETGYALVYRSWVGGWLMAMGNLYLLQYQDGNLTEIGYYEIWYS